MTNTILSGVDRNSVNAFWRTRRTQGCRLAIALLACLALVTNDAQATIILPEKLHPVAEAYRRARFVLNLNPVVWEQVRSDIAAITNYWRALDANAAKEFQAGVDQIIERATVGPDEEKGIEPLPRQEASAQVFQLMTKTVTALVRHHLEAAEQKLEDREAAMEVRQAQGVWAAFEVAVRAADPEGYRRLGRSWLAMSSALGSPGLLKVGTVAPDRETFRQRARKVLAYTEANFGPDFVAVEGRKLAPWPVKSPTFDPVARLPIKLPPGHNINKQLPRPRQILNMAARGVDESETVLIALGDMAFDSSFILGEPARSLAFTCNTCHNKGVTNPNFTIPGLSVRPGGVDVSSSYLAPHANNGHFDPVDIPDLRGIRFTAPYGRNGRFASLREFVRNGIINEFNGPEPDPMLLDGLILYMIEFDFLSNPYLNRDSTLNEKASEAARRGEKIFNKPFAQMGGRSCASCHVPSSHFLDRQRHDIGTARGYEPYSQDRALDTPTLLGIKYTAPYFHDGSQPTLRAVNEWFNNTYQLGLTSSELDDLTTYVETVGDGIDAYEDTPYILEAEMEEFGFFLSTFEFLDEKNKPELMNITFRTIALEVRNHKWALQDYSALPVMERLAEIMDEAYIANQAGDREKVREKVKEYRKLYAENIDVLK